MKSKLLNELYNSGNYEEAASNYNLAYKMSPEKTDLVLMS